MTTETTYTRHYNWDDISALTSGLSLTHLSHSGTLRVLKGVEGKLELFGHLLHHYPARQYHPLAFLYASRRALDAYNSQLLTDLLMDGMHTLHTLQTFGLWLNCLKITPCDEMAVRTTTPLSRGAKELQLIALARHGDVLPVELDQLSRKVETFRDLVDSMPARPHPLRLSPAGDILKAYLVERDRLKEAYRAGGFGKAKPLLKQPLLQYYLLTPAQWRQAGAPVIPPLS